MKADYFVLAIRNLRHRGLRTFLTVLGIFIGIAAVVSLISVGDGLKAAVNAQFGISSTQVITVQAGGLSAYGPPGTGVSVPLTRDDAEAINDINNVKIAIPRSIETVKMDFNDKLEVGFAASLPDDKESRDYVYELLDIDVLEGDFIEDIESKVLLGNNYYFADKSGFDKAIRRGDVISINNQDFVVEGILEKKGSFIIDSAVMISDFQLDKISDVGETADLIAVVVDDKDQMPLVESEIEKLLRKRRDVKIGEENFEVSTPEAALGTINGILTGVQIFIVMIAFISIIVGTVGIVNTMTTAIMERKKEIGIMKSIGAKNSDIFYQFFIEAGILGLIGGIAGAAVGTLIGYFGTLAISNFIGSELKSEINFFLISAALLGSFVIGAVSGIIPAIRAAKLNPVEALRT